MQPIQPDYTDPRFYHWGHPPQPSPLAPPGRSEPLALPQSDAYEMLQMREYTGPASLQRAVAEGHVEPEVSRPRGRLAELGGVGAALGILLKFGLASVTAVISIFIYAQLFGWGFGIGLVALLFIHEMGHAVVMKLKGLPVGGMIFIPMLGAAVFMRRMPGNARDEAEVGIAGPVAGALASLVCLFFALSWPASPGVWAPLAYFGFFLNLFNLIPIIPFDGGRVLSALDRRVWLLGFFALVAVQVWQWVSGNSSIWLLIFIVMAATEFWARRRAAASPEGRAYYATPVGERIVIGLAYFGLIGVLVLGMAAAHSLMSGGVLQ
ncbi:MAG TPA: site-2 protease family protein [Ktedonobacteraceae bacterium]